MKTVNRTVLVTFISVFCFLLSAQAHFSTKPPAIVSLLSEPFTPSTNWSLQSFEPIVHSKATQLQAPVLYGEDIDARLIREWLSDRSTETFITFDDGPSAQATDLILDLLKQHHAKATFFVLGRNAAKSPDVVRRIVAEGHELALHSQTHADLLSLTRDQKEAEIVQSLALLRGLFPNLRIRWFRPPYARYDQEVIDIAHENGMCIALFDEISTHSHSSAEEIAQVVRRGRGRIMVFHDGQWPRSEPMTQAESRLVAGLSAAIGPTKEQGAQFMTLSSHFGRFCP